MPKKRITAFFTGNYWITKDYRREIDRLIDLAIEQDTRHFLCGMQLGFDQVVADILIDRKMPWTAVLAHPNIDRAWKTRQQSRFRKQLTKAPQTVILYPQFHRSKTASVRYMIRKSDICLSINSGYHWDDVLKTDRGGPGDVIDLAIANNLQVFQINPVGRVLLVTHPPKQLCFAFK
jgi:hypothetical protein